MVWLLKVVLEPHDGVNLLLGGHVRVLREPQAYSLHELTDGSRSRTPGLQVMLEEDVIIERIVSVVQTWGLRDL